jgi:hypothetical protein
MKTSLTRKLIWLTLFSIAMGYLETAIVVYIRKLYYPEGFDFPLVPISKDIAITEVWRELATMVMLAGIGILAGKNRQQRFAYFIYCFAIWDIFYYVFLYVLLGWPQSLLTWDILFLIPVPWVGPVLCPCLVSLSMIALGMITVYWEEKGKVARTKFLERMVMLAGCALILVSFMWDYVAFVLAHHGDKGPWSYSFHKELFSEAVGYVPTEFNWLLYIPGQVMMAGGVLLFALRMRREKAVVENKEVAQSAETVAVRS